METKTTHQEIADKLNLSISGVSRLRSGERTPSLPVMQRIESTYGYTVQQQSDALKNSLQAWTVGFEKALN